MSLYLNDNLYSEYNKVNIFFQKALYKDENAEKARAYLEERKIGEDLIKKFSIGWCPPESKINSRMNHLKGRVIFPIKDEYGDMLAFSGRLPLKTDQMTSEQKTKRWWNESFNKSFFFYGLDVALPSILQKKFVILVEGQIDVITCHKFGLTMAVGLMSHNLTPYHIAKLTRLTRNFVLMLDGDDVGRKSSYKIQKQFSLMRSPGKNGKYTVIDINLRVKDNVYDPDEFLNKYGPKPVIKKIIEKKEKIERGKNGKKEFC
jgi:DNA primase